MRRINSIEEIAKEVIDENGKKRYERLIDDFTDMDLSGLDLSVLPENFWNWAIFYNTNFSNSKINFKPDYLKGRSIEYCNFENVDLGYIEFEEWDCTKIKGANLINTNINISPYCNPFIDETLGAVKFDECAGEYLKVLHMDFDTLDANSWIKKRDLSSEKICKIISNSLPAIGEYIPTKLIKPYLERCENALKKYDNGDFSKLYSIFCSNCTDFEKLRFFQGVVQKRSFDDIELIDINLSIFRNLDIINCRFKKLTIKEDLCEFFWGKYQYLLSYNTFDEIEILNLKPDSWNEVPLSRMGHSSITLKKNLYLELGKKCNCRCEFCRNKSFENCSYNFNNIKANLRKFINEIDTIAIGGGEPTLVYEDCFELIENFRNVDFALVTNGSDILKSDDFIYKLNCLKFRSHLPLIYISRHAISDEENLKLLNPIEGTKILTFSEIKDYVFLNLVTFTPVCRKGGLDSVYKIEEYIQKTFEIGVKRIIFSNLHDDASLGKRDLTYSNLKIDLEIFDEVKQNLLEQGFNQSIQICSTGGYVLDVFKKDDMVITFKTYISKEETEKLWKKSIKRTFDFTMTPDGEIFEDWSQENKINLEELEGSN